MSSYEGGCLCGAVRCRSVAALIRDVICHCSQCRRHSGAPALAFFHFPATGFTWTPGGPEWYRSSKYAERGFCAACGSIVAMREEVLDDRVQVTAGSLDQPGSVKPDDHVWTEDQLPWLLVCDGLPKFSRSSTTAASKAEED